MGITDLQEPVEVLAQIGISIQQVARQAMNKMAKKIGYSGKKKKEHYLWLAGPDGKRSGKALSTWKGGVKTQAAKYEC